MVFNLSAGQMDIEIRGINMKLVNFSIKIKTIICFGVMCFVFVGSFPSKSNAQGVAGAMTVSVLIDQLGQVGEDLINLGFDRLDQSIVNTGNELRSTAAALRIEYEGALNKTFDELEGAQKVVLQNTQSLLHSLESSVEETAEVINVKALETISPLYGLFGGKPRVVSMRVDQTGWGSESFDINAKGVAISEGKATLVIADNVVKSTPTKKSDTQISYRISPDSWADVEVAKNNITRIPISVIIEFCDGFWIFCKKRTNTYNSEIALFPEVIGTVKTFYSYKKTEPTIKKICSAEFISSRVQARVSGLRIRRGSRGDTWSLAPESGWAFITDMSSSKKPTYSFNLNHGGCSGSSSRAHGFRVTPTLIQIGATTSSDRRLGATCTTTTRLCAYQSKDEEVTKQGVLPEETLTVSNTITQILPDKKSHLSHVVVNSPMFRDGKKTYLKDDESEIDITYEPASQNIFVRLARD